MLVAVFLLPFSGLAVAGTEPEGSTSSPVVGSVEPSSGEAGDTVTVTVDNPPHIVSSAHGNGFGLAITDEGAVLTWGSGEHGQLGNGTTNSSLTPILLDADAFNGERVAEVFAGKSTAYAKTVEGDLYRWGKDVSTEPIGVSLFADGSDVAQIAAAGDWVIALSEAGEVVALDPEGVVLPLGDEGEVTQIAAHDNLIVAQTSSGELLLALLPDLEFHSLGQADVKRIVVGEGWFAGLDTQGEVWVADFAEAWSLATAVEQEDLEEAPQSEVEEEPAPEEGWEPESLSVEEVEQVASSGEELLILDSQGSVFDWSPGSKLEDVSLSALSGEDPIAISAGFGGKFVLAGGQLFAWGDGQAGQLGTGSPDSGATPATSVNIWPTEVRFGDETAEDVEPLSPGALVVGVPAGIAGTTVHVSVGYSPRSGESPGTSTALVSLPSAFDYAADTETEEQQSNEGGESPKNEPTPKARSMAGALPMAAPRQVEPNDPIKVWVETFDARPAQSWNNSPTDTAKVVNYKGIAPNAQTPVIGSTWGATQNCVGIRLPYGRTLPNTGLGTNSNYCGAISYWGVFDQGRERWWNVARAYAGALGSNVAAYITDANVTQTGLNTPDQTALYQTQGLNFISPATGDDGNPDWEGGTRLDRRTGQVEILLGLL